MTDYAEMQLQIVEAASSLVARLRFWPSIAVIAEELNIKRTTAYYYVRDHKSLLLMIESWAAEFLTECLRASEFQESVEKWIEFSLINREAVQLLIDGLINRRDVKQSAIWDCWLGCLQQFRGTRESEDKEMIEVRLAWLIGGFLLGPRIFQSQSATELSINLIVGRFRGLRHDYPFSL